MRKVNRKHEMKKELGMKRIKRRSRDKEERDE